MGTKDYFGLNEKKVVAGPRTCLSRSLLATGRREIAKDNSLKEGFEHQLHV